MADVPDALAGWVCICEGAAVRKGFVVSSEGLAKGFVAASMSGRAGGGPCAAAADAGSVLLALPSGSGAASFCSWAFEELYRGCLPVKSPLRGCCCACCWGGYSCCLAWGTLKSFFSSIAATACMRARTGHQHAQLQSAYEDITIAAQLGKGFEPVHSHAKTLVCEFSLEHLQARLHWGSMEGTQAMQDVGADGNQPS